MSWCVGNSTARCSTARPLLYPLPHMGVVWAEVLTGWCLSSLLKNEWNRCLLYSSLRNDLDNGTFCSKRACRLLLHIGWRSLVRTPALLTKGLITQREQQTQENAKQWMWVYLSHFAVWLLCSVQNGQRSVGAEGFRKILAVGGVEVSSRRGKTRR